MLLPQAPDIEGWPSAAPAVVESPRQWDALRCPRCAVANYDVDIPSLSSLQLWSLWRPLTAQVRGASCSMRAFVLLSVVHAAKRYDDGEVQIPSQLYA